MRPSWRLLCWAGALRAPGTTGVAEDRHQAGPAALFSPDACPAEQGLCLPAQLCSLGTWSLTEQGTLAASLPAMIALSAPPVTPCTPGLYTCPPHQPLLQGLSGLTNACASRHKFTGLATARGALQPPPLPASPGRPRTPVSREIQTARYVSKPGWDDSVQMTGTPRDSTPRAVHLPVAAVKRIPMTPGAARLSAWRSAKVHSEKLHWWA